MILAGCSSDGDAKTTDRPVITPEAGLADEVTPPVTMPLLGTRPIPPELTALTGIAWDVASGYFVVVTDSGQLASFDGDSFALTGTADSGVARLSDITADADAGPVLDATERTRLRQRFARGRNGKGAGLGLAIIQAIVDGGGVEVELVSPIPGQDDGVRAQVMLEALPGRRQA